MIMFKFGEECRQIVIPSDYTVPNIMPFIGMWQMFANYEGIDENELHSFKVPSFLDSLYQVTLKFQDKQLVKIGHADSELWVNISQFEKS